MIETKLMNYLSTELEVDVFVENPTPPPEEEYIVIEKTGSSERNFITTATIAVQSICKGSMIKAAKLNERVKEKMRSFVEERGITNVRLDTDYNFTKTASKQYRYQAVYNITYYQEVE